MKNRNDKALSFTIFMFAMGAIALLTTAISYHMWGRNVKIATTELDIGPQPEITGIIHQLEDTAVRFSFVDHGPFDDDTNPFISRCVLDIGMDGTIEVFNPEGARSILINPDGSSEIGPDYKPDVAAKQFWKAVAQYMPELEQEPELNAEWSPF